MSLSPRRVAALVVGFVVLAVPCAGPARGGEDEKPKTSRVEAFCDTKGARFFLLGKELLAGEGEIPPGRQSVTVTVLVEDCAPLRRTAVVHWGGLTWVKFPAPQRAPWPTLSTNEAGTLVAWESTEYGWFDGPKVPPSEGRPVLGRPGMATQFLERRRLGNAQSCVVEPGPWTQRGTVLDLLEVPLGTEVWLDGAKVADGARVAAGKHVLTVGSNPKRTYNLDVKPTQPVVRVPSLLARRDAVDRGVVWLAEHQSADGRWASSRFPCECPERCESGVQGYDVGVTGLALLAFQGADDSPDCGPHAQTVSKGLAFLLRQQRADGWFDAPGSRASAFAQPIALLAVLDAWSRTGDPKLYDAAKRGLGAIYDAQNPFLGWRYEPKGGDNDTAVTAWMSLAVTHALAWDLERQPFADLRGAGPPIRSTYRAGVSLAAAANWIYRMTDLENGKTGYQSRGGPPAYFAEFDRGWGLTAMSQLPMRRADALFSGGRGETESMRDGLGSVAEYAPFDPQRVRFDDVHAAYFGARLLAWQRGSLPPRWRIGIAALAARQVPSGRFPNCELWSGDGGAVFTTAMSVMALEQDRQR